VSAGGRGVDDGAERSASAGGARHAFVGPAEHDRRREAFLAGLADDGLEGVCLFGNLSIHYLSGFAFQPTERPVALVLRSSGESALVVPELERDHVEALGRAFDRVVAYPEYPGERHPMEFVGDVLSRLGLMRGRLGVDRTSYGTYWGSDGRPLATVAPDATLVSVAARIDAMRRIKSPLELEALRASAALADRCHEQLVAALREGESEVVLSLEASARGTRTLLDAMPEGYALTQWGAVPAHVGFKAGPETAWPHPMGTDRRLRRGDHVNTWALIAVDGYRAELERTLVFGEPTHAQISAFEHMMALQSAALEAIAPGRPCADVERAVRGAAAERGIANTLRHHVGHALGLESHEAPFLDLGERTILEPGMVFSVEPGVYLPGLGGFRHSDTVVVREEGVEVLTRTPRELDELVAW
jgi:Xaa-Pro dipeptidase